MGTFSLCVTLLALSLACQWHASSLRMSMSTAATNLPALTAARPFLKVLLSRRGPLPEKAALVQALQGLRAQENDASVPRAESRDTKPVWAGDKASFLDLLLAEMKSAPRLARVPLLAFLPSYRVKLAALQRVVALVLAEENEAAGAARVLVKSPQPEDALLEYRQQRSRRALSIVLGQLQGQEGGIRALEREARGRANNAGAMAEMLSRTPANLETPKYGVLFSDDRAGWEVRRYEAFSVCSMVMPEGAGVGDGPGAFNSLAGYIFGKNANAEAMKMTTPVISSGGGQEGGDKKMSFVMPSKFWGDVDAAPRPVDAVVRVETYRTPVAEAEVGDVVLAAKWFGGYCTATEVERRSAQLRKDIIGSADYVMAGDGAAIVFQYNDPFQPPWKRRNEVCFPVKPREKGGVRPFEG